MKVEEEQHRGVLININKGDRCRRRPAWPADTITTTTTTKQAHSHTIRYRT